jgi:uridine phosphorylase
METFHLLHLASNWPRPPNTPDIQGAPDQLPPPPTGMPAGSLIPSLYTLSETVKRAVTHVVPEETEDDPDPEETILYPVSATKQSSHFSSAHVTPPPEPVNHVAPVPPSPRPTSRKRIRAAAVQMIFAERTSRAFISPEQVETLQEGAARALLETLIKWRQAESTEVPS